MKTIKSMKWNNYRSAYPFLQRKKQKEEGQSRKQKKKRRKKRKKENYRTARMKWNDRQSQLMFHHDEVSFYGLLIPTSRVHHARRTLANITHCFPSTRRIRIYIRLV